MATPTTTTPDGNPISHGDRGDWLQTRPGEHCLIRVSAAETKGAYSVVEIVSSPGDGTPMHVHQNEDEHILVVEGTARVACGDKTFDAAAGTTVTLTKNVHPIIDPGMVVGELLVAMSDAKLVQPPHEPAGPVVSNGTQSGPRIGMEKGPLTGFGTGLSR